MTTKTALRAEVRKKRAELLPELIEEKSEAVAERITDFGKWQDAHCVALYAAFDNEVRTDTLARAAWSTGKIVGFPRVNQHGGTLIFHRVHSWEDLSVDHSTWAIPEPDASEPVLEPSQFDLWIVPGVAFDTECNRLGYGKGFYDRALRDARPDAVKIGVSFEAQLIDSVPTTDDDVQLDAVVTESRWIG